MVVKEKEKGKNGKNSKNTHEKVKKACANGKSSVGELVVTNQNNNSASVSGTLPTKVSDQDNMIKSMSEAISTGFKTLGDSFKKSIGDLQSSFKQSMDTLNATIYEEPYEYEEPTDPDRVDEDNENIDEPGVEGLSGPSLSGSKRPAEAHTALQRLKAKAVKVETTGPEVDQGLAESITEIMQSEPSEEFEANILNKIHRPANCEGLAQITLNQAVWDRVSPATRSFDKRMQKEQTSLVKGTVELVYMYDKLCKKFPQTEDPELVEILDHGNNAFLCFGSANWENVQRRRECIKTDINYDFSHMCGSKQPYDKQLFGENVSKLIKEISEENRVSSKLNYNQRRGRGRGSRGRGGRPFRGRGRGGRGRARGGYQNQGNWLGGRKKAPKEKTD